jgi:methionyl-tRNA formyltransferase
MSKRIAFMGTPGFAVPALEALHQAGHQILAVYCQPPKPTGRGMQLTPTPVHQAAEKLGLTVRTPEKLNADEVTHLTSLNLDLICVAAYGLLLPGSVLKVAPCINVHPSALPRWRGAAPLNHTLLQGDATTDLCIMAMEKGLDTGAVYKRVPYTLSLDMTFGDLHELMAREGATHLLDVVNHWNDYKDNALPQTEEGMVYAPKILPADRVTDFTRSATEVHNHIRGLSPFPAATMQLEGAAYKLLRSTVVQGQGRPGTVLQADKQNGLVIACGTGAVRLLELQREGKRAMRDIELLNGQSIALGSQAE